MIKWVPALSEDQSSLPSTPVPGGDSLFWLPGALTHTVCTLKKKKTQKTKNYISVDRLVLFCQLLSEKLHVAMGGGMSKC